MAPTTTRTLVSTWAVRTQTWPSPNHAAASPLLLAAQRPPALLACSYLKSGSLPPPPETGLLMLSHRTSQAWSQDRSAPSPLEDGLGPPALSLRSSPNLLGCSVPAGHTWAWLTASLSILTPSPSLETWTSTWAILTTLWPLRASTTSLLVVHAAYTQVGDNISTTDMSEEVSFIFKIMTPIARVTI